MPEVDRHPLYVAYYAQLERENARCLLRASARNKMKRFITDVHTVWLTNLSHHPEFGHMLTGANGERTDRGVDGNVVDQPETIAKRRGLDGGRDSSAIAASQSQIQSVQPKRAFRAAVFYSSKCKNNDVEEGKAGGQRLREKTPATTARSYVDVDAEGGESPELPPPPVGIPTLTVLASGRHRLAPGSTQGNNRRSFEGGGTRQLGGGGKGGWRRSISGGGATSIVDTCARVLRVLCFSSPAAAPSNVGNSNVSTDAVEAEQGDGFAGSAGDALLISNTSFDISPTLTGTTATIREQEKKDEGDPASSLLPTLLQTPEQLQLTPQPQLETKWMISSFHAYDGSETHAFVGGIAVNRVVEMALSSPAPLLLKGSSLSGSDTQGQTEGEGKEEGRLLLLRRGVRVPVLDANACVAGNVLSIVEVRLVRECRVSKKATLFWVLNHNRFWGSFRTLNSDRLGAITASERIDEQSA